MKDLIDQILKYLPLYLTNFGSIFVGPKSFIASRNVSSDDAFGDALLFLGVSIALIIVMGAPLFPPGKDLWTHVGSVAIQALVTVSLSAMVVRTAWWIVGGRASARSFFVTYAFFFGVALVIISVVQLLSFGFFKVFEPELFGQFIAATQRRGVMPDMSGDWVPLTALSIYIVGYLIICLWLFIAWGAYRNINGLSKLRSFLALMIAGILTWPVTAITVFVQSAIS